MPDSTPTVHHAAVTVTDLGTVVPFYRDVLGLEVLDRFDVSGDAFAAAVDVPGASARFVHLDGGGTRIELVEYDPSGEPNTDHGVSVNQPGTAHVGLAVDDLDRFLEMRSADLEANGRPRTTASGTRILFCRDPEGNLIELLES